MARFTPTWTNTEATDWEAGDFFRIDKFRDQFGQNIEWLAQSHSHDGTANSGAIIPTADPKYIIFYATPAGSPFA